MKVLLAILLSISVAVAAIILVYYMYLSVASSSVGIELLEILPSGSNRSYLLLKLSNPTPMRMYIEIRGVLYVNGVAVSTMSIPIEVPPHEEIVARAPFMLSENLGKAQRVFVELRGSATFRCVGIPLLSSISFTKGLDLRGGIPVSPCYISVVDAGFSPSIASVGQRVVAWADLYSSDKCVARVELRILEDNALGPDVPMTLQVFEIPFPGEHVVKLVWEPPFPSSGNVRGYYIEVLVNGTEIYAMPPRYPPRLRVVTTPVSTSSTTTSYLPLRIVDAWWSVGSHRVWVAKVGQSVSACVEIVASRAWSGEVTLKVMRDAPISLAVTSRTFSLRLAAGSSATLCLTFSPPAPSSGTMRGYYLVVESGGKTLYISPPSYPPRLRVVP